MPMLVSAGSISRHATSPSREPGVEGVEVVERHHRGGGGDVDLRSQRARPRDDPVARATVLEHAERLVDRAVVAPVHHRDPRPAGEVAGEAEHEAVGVGGRHRHLPPGQAEAAAELAGDPGGVRRGQHRGDPALGALAHRLGHRRQAVAGHRAGVAEAQVDEVDAVDVGEAAARGRLDEQRERARATGSSTASGRPPAGARPPPAPAAPRWGAGRRSAAPPPRGGRPAGTRSTVVTARLTGRCRRTWSRGTPRCPRSRPRGRSPSASRRRTGRRGWTRCRC